MALYCQGCTTVRRRGNPNPITSILDIDFNNGLFIYVFPGQLSQNDIWLKFKDFNIPRTQIRTPKHIHWTVDLLIKKDNDPTLTDRFLNAMLQRWNTVNSLPNRTYTTILNNLTLSRNQSFIDYYNPLNPYGFFTMEFLTHLMELLMLQEITNNPNAYMFRDVVNALLTSDDLYGIIAKAGFGGRR